MFVGVDFLGSMFLSGHIESLLSEARGLEITFKFKGSLYFVRVPSTWSSDDIVLVSVDPSYLKDLR